MIEVPKDISTDSRGKFWKIDKLKMKLKLKRYLLGPFTFTDVKLKRRPTIMHGVLLDFELMLLCMNYHRSQLQINEKLVSIVTAGTTLGLLVQAPAQLPIETIMGFQNKQS